MFIRFQKSYTPQVFEPRIGLMHIKSPCSGTLVKFTVWSRRLTTKANTYYDLRHNGAKIVTDLLVPPISPSFIDRARMTLGTIATSVPVEFGDILSLDITNIAANGGNYLITMQCDFET